MAKLEYTLIADVSLIMKAYKRGFEDAFLLMNDSADLDETLNINNISTEEDAE